MKRKLWTLLLAVGMMLALCVGVRAETKQEDFYEVLTAESGSIKLENSIEYGSLMVVHGSLTIDLNGHVLEVPGGIYVAQNAQLTIKDSNSSASHKFRTPSSNGRWELDETNGTKTVTGGVITGGTGQQNSSGYEIPGGGGIYVASGGTLHMESGSIAGCSAGYGGGVYVSGSFTMSGSSAIIGCSAGNGGGGVFVEGEFLMKDSASIAGCVAQNPGSVTRTGGGVLVEDTGTFTMEGSASIRDCIADTGGGVTVNSGSSNGQFIMKGGQITGCKATTDRGGGGILNDGEVTMMGGEITNCTDAPEDPREPKSGGVRNSGRFTMSGGTIEAGCTIFSIDSTGETVFTISDSAKIDADITNCADIVANGGHVHGTVQNGYNYGPGTIAGSGGTVFSGAVTNSIINGYRSTMEDLLHLVPPMLEKENADAQLRFF